MKKLILLLLFIPLVSFGQEQAVKFKIDKPIGWVDNTSYYKDNTAKKTNLQTLLKDGTNKETLIESITDPSLYVFTKYNLEDVSSTDFIPSINVVLSTDTNWELRDMKVVSKEIFSQMRLSLDNFKLIKNDYIVINGKEGFLFHSTFNLNTINETIRSWTYFFFIDKGLFYQITFADTEGDKCDKVFEDALKSIRFDNKYSNSLVDENFERTYYKNGLLMNEGNIKSGKQEGFWKSYNKDGQLESEVMYKDGKQEGYARYYKDGQLESERMYKDGKQEGYAKYYERGYIFSEGAINGGNKDGIWKYYNEQGILTEQTTYINGDITYKTIFNKKGIIVKKGIIMDGKFIVPYKLETLPKIEDSKNFNNIEVKTLNINMFKKD